MGGVSETELDGVSPRIVSRLKTTSRAGGGVLVALGVAVLFGWWLRVPRLLNLSVGYAMMKPNTAFCLICLGSTLYLLDAPHSGLRWVRRIAPGAVLAIASLTLLEYLVGRDLGIDTLLARSAASDGWIVRMTPGAAMNFCLLASALVLLGAHRARPPSDRWRRRTAQWFA